MRKNTILSSLCMSLCAVAAGATFNVAPAALTDFIRSSPHTPAAVAGAQEALCRLLLKGGGSAQDGTKVTKASKVDPFIENDSLKITFGGEGDGFANAMGTTWSLHPSCGVRAVWSCAGGSGHGQLWVGHCSGYRYEESVTIGFSQTRLSGTGACDLGDAMIMPVERMNDGED